MTKHVGISYSRQNQFQVEKDLRCEPIELDDSDSSVKTAYILGAKSAFLGEFVIAEEARKELLTDAHRIFENLCSRKNADLELMNGKILVAACVLLLQDNNDTDENESAENGRFWKTILEGLGFEGITRRTGCSEQTARNRLCSLFDSQNNLRFLTTNGHRYYNTLKLHALSPAWSIKNLFEILFSFYRRNLECNYVADSNVASMFVSGIRRRWERSGSEEDYNLRASLLSSGMRELFVLRPNYMAAVCDALLDRIDHLAQGDSTILDSANRWDMLLRDWYLRKSEYEKTQVRKERKQAVKRKIAEEKESIHPEYAFEGNCIYLRIPGIRLPEITEQPIVHLFQNERVLLERKLSIYGNDVLWSTRPCDIPLNGVKSIQWNGPLCFSVSISVGDNLIYKSGAELFRDYLCFSPVGNETVFKRSSQMLRLIFGRTADFQLDAPEDSWDEETAPYRLIRIWTESARSVVLFGKEILQDYYENRQKIWAYMTPEAETSVSAYYNEQTIQIYAHQPELYVVCNNANEAKNYQLTVDGEISSLYQYNWDDGQFHIPLSNSTMQPVSIQLKVFETGKIVFKRDYIVIPGFAYSFDSAYYFNIECKAVLSVTMSGISEKYFFDIEPDNDTVTWKMGNILFETAVPRLKVELDGKNAFYLAPMLWHQNLKYAFLSLHGPDDIHYSVYLGDQLLSPNAMGLFEIGAALANISNAVEYVRLSMRIQESDTIAPLELELTSVRFQETFVDDPIIQNDRTILWRPSETEYIGSAKNAAFRLLLDNSSQAEPYSYRLSLKDGFIEKHFPGRGGTYQYSLWLIERKRVFSSLPDLKLLEGTITVVDPPEERFVDKCIILTNALYEDPVSQHDASCHMQQDSTRINDIRYEGVYFLDDGSEVHEYSGIMSFRTASSWIKFSDRDTEQFEKINPVFFTVDSDNLLKVYTEYDEALMLNLKTVIQNPKYGAARIYGKKDELTQKEQSQYLGFADRFQFVEKMTGRP